jgi:hypothetical protein
VTIIVTTNVLVTFFDSWYAGSLKIAAGGAKVVMIEQTFATTVPERSLLDFRSGCGDFIAGDVRITEFMVMETGTKGNLRCNRFVP